MQDRILTIMCKYPEAGRVKTRLGREIGMSRAAKICKFLLDDLLDSLVGLDWKTAIIDSQRSTLSAFKHLYPGMDIVHVDGDELRGPNSVLWNAFQRFCSQYHRVVTLNADTVFLTKEIINQSFAALDGYDLVLGPCSNGGIYLIGMKQPIDLFTRLPRGPNPKYYDETIEIISRAGLTYVLMASLYDLDTLEDIHRIAWASQAGWKRTREYLLTEGLLSLPQP